MEDYIEVRYNDEPDAIYSYTMLQWLIITDLL